MSTQSGNHLPISNFSSLSSKPNLHKINQTALIAVDGIGPGIFRNICHYLKLNRIAWQEFWVNKDKIWQKMSLPKNVVSSIKNFKKEYTVDSFWQMLSNKNISVITHEEDDYPYLLKQADDHPPVLFVLGKTDLFTKLASRLPIAIVGTRRMTAYGRLVTGKISRELVSNNVTIVSGFMYGVDLQAQQVALECGGFTIGVLGYGFDNVFPKRHQELLNYMLQSNRAVFVSEYPPFVQPSRGTFPRRNRIIAGLSLAVVVTEAGPKSGTQITVGYALDYGRDVFAASGPITSPYHEGVKQMLNQGATLISSGQEVIQNLSAHNWQGIEAGQDLAQNSCHSQPEDEPCFSSIALNPLQKKMMKALRLLPLSVEQLSEQLQEDFVLLNAELIRLELQGLVQCSANRWSAVEL